MRPTGKLVLGLSLGLILMTVGIYANSPDDDAQKMVLKARADIKGPPGSTVTGEITLVQKKTGNLPTVNVTVKVQGLAPNSIHGMHFHEKGLCEAPAFTTAGGHFDPGPFGMSNPDANHPFHMGDLPNLVADSKGVAVVKHTTNRITLSAGPLSIFDEDGTAIIIHQNQDMGVPGAAGSGVAGGPRIACGVIQLVK